MEFPGSKRIKQSLPDSHDELIPRLSKMTAGDAPITIKHTVDGEEKEVVPYNFYDGVTENKIYTHNWTTALEVNLKGLVPFFTTSKLLGGSVLEIGAYEGAGSNLIHKYLQPIKQVACDPWDDSYVEGEVEFKNQYDNFKHNTKRFNITEMRMTSDKMFSELDNVKFDFIYIDGDHSYEQVLRDLNNSFKVLKVGGVILVDDYAWIKDTVRRAVNDFYNAHFDNALRLCLDWDYQFAFVKTKNYTVVEDGKITHSD